QKTCLLCGIMGVSPLLVPLALFLSHVLGALVDPTLPFSDYLYPGNSTMLQWGFDLVKNSILFDTVCFLKDRHAVRNSVPLLDKQQDYELVYLTEAYGQTVMKFRRSISACDENDCLITVMPVKLIYAYGETDNISFHGSHQGTKEVNLLKFMPRVSVPDSKYFDLTMTNFTVPAQNSHYHCKVMRNPALDRKYHIYRVEPLIDNLDLVHHLLLYRCPPIVTSPKEQACYTEEAQAECYQTVAAWGVGGGAFELPKVAGIPVGDDGGETFYRLEVHYNNQYETPSHVDNSDLLFYYTPQLWHCCDNATDFLSYGLCDAGYIPQVQEAAQDLQVFSVILHTHLAGRKVRVGQFSFLSGFKPHHRTESGFLKVTNYLLLSVDSGDCAILLLLDLRAAFDTADHNPFHQLFLTRHFFLKPTYAVFTKILTFTSVFLFWNLFLGESRIYTHSCPKGQTILF
uniref:Monooxygenase, DBH-like 1, like n=1 Tax=Pygocentrus nattereri TaxID=42514 RepID=A0A3B4C915_PYGNA